MKITISNSFTGFEATTQSENPKTIKAILRKSKASDCDSVTTIVDEDGNHLELFDNGRGESLVVVG